MHNHGIAANGFVGLYQLDAFHIAISTKRWDICGEPDLDKLLIPGTELEELVGSVGHIRRELGRDIEGSIADVVIIHDDLGLVEFSHESIEVCRLTQEAGYAARIICKVISICFRIIAGCVEVRVDYIEPRVVIGCVGGDTALDCLQARLKISQFRDGGLQGCDCRDLGVNVAINSIEGRREVCDGLFELCHVAGGLDYHFMVRRDLLIDDDELAPNIRQVTRNGVTL